MTSSANEVETRDFTSQSADLGITQPKPTKIEHQKVEEKILLSEINLK